MNKITQDMRFKQAVIEYSLKHRVTKAAIRYKTNRQNIYRWRKKVEGGADGAIAGLETVIGQEGTLVMPTPCRKDFLNSCKTWCRGKPSEVGCARRPHNPSEKKNPSCAFGA